jgi:hypothetical protein
MSATPKPAARTTGAVEPAKPAKKAPLRVKATAPDETRAQTYAKLTADGVLPLTFTAEMFGRALAGGECDLTAMHARLMETAKDAEAGNMGRLERMLSAQAQTLNIMFTELARRAALNMGERMPAAEMYLRMAFKAQAQSRATVEALAEMKNPRAVAFVKQANIAQQQQVNNGAAVSPARETTKPANEQSCLEAPNEWSALETGTKAAPARGNPAMETVGAVHRAEDARGQGRIVGE